MWSARSVSIMLPRVSRAKIASCGSASAITGQSKSRGPPLPQPPAEAHDSMTAKISDSTGPTTKFGTVSPTVATAMTA